MISRFNRSLFTAAGLSALLALSAPMTAATHASDWPTLGGDEKRAGVSDEKIVPPLSLLWRYTAVPNGSAAAADAAPTVVGDTAYFAAKNNPDKNAGAVLFALDTKTGARKWVYPNDYGMRDKTVFLTAPVVSGDSIYIGASDGYLYILDKNSGREKSKIRESGGIGGAPVVLDNTVYFGSNDHHVYAFDTATLAPSPGWKTPFAALEAINSALLVADGYLYFTTSDQYVHALVLGSGRTKWASRLPFKFEGNALAYADNTLYIPSGPRLFAFQPTSGNFRWTVDLPGEILAPPAAGDGVVFVGCRDSASQQFLFYAIRSGNHRSFWASPITLPGAPSAAATIVGDVVYVPTKRGIIVALDRLTGATLWQYRMQPSSNHLIDTPPTETTIAASLAVANGTVYAVAGDGSISAFRADAPDTSAPLLTARYPAPAQSIYGGPGMVITGTVVDPGSGLDTSSIQMTLDHIAVTTGYNAALNLAYYQRKGSSKQVDTGSSLSNGRHEVTLTAKDYRGNVLNETWSFIVDNNLKAPGVNYDTPNVPATSPTRPGGITAPGRRRSGL